DGGHLVLLYIHKMRNQRASPERGGARRAEGLTMKSNIFLFVLPVNSNKNFYVDFSAIFEKSLRY
ncbi:MAG: hypothetical protein J6O04_00005, partial [Selenomonadaceae bacterium]|nr:hypothetical protein [Selenomonadaceae bacterium]